MSPKELIERLEHLAEAARHHPEPAVAVHQLAVLVLELASQLEPMVAKLNILLAAAGFPDDNLADLVNQAEAELAASDEEQPELDDLPPTGDQTPAA